MIFSEKKRIESFEGWSYSSFDKILLQGYLIFSSGNNVINVYSSKTLEFLPEKRIDSYNLIEVKYKFFYILNRELFEFYFSNFTCRRLFSTKEDALNFFYPDLVCIGTSDWRAKVNNFFLVRLSGEKVFNWVDNRKLIGIFNERTLFIDANTSDLYCIDLESKQEIWRMPFDSDFAGIRYIQGIDDKEQIIQRYLKLEVYNLLKLNINTGQIVWEIEDTFNHYNYDSSSNKLYGLGGKTFEIINVESGMRELQIVLKENLYIAPHLTYYADGYLYFSGYRDNNIPVFGAVDVKTGELVFTQTVEMPGKKSFRKGLDRPVVVGNRLYVRDAMKTLHIYERIDTEA